MNRRRYLATVLGGAVGASAGCASPVVPGRGRQPESGGEPAPGSGTRAGSDTGTGPGNGPDADPRRDTASRPDTITGADGLPSRICEMQPEPEQIPAIVDPKFAPEDAAVPSTLSDSEPVIGIERDGDARAYPIIATNEIVNDAFDVPVLVTYCPLCASGMTAIRRVDGRETVFENTSHVWRPPGAVGDAAIASDRVFGIGYSGGPGEVEARNEANLVMFDRATGSYWSQLLGQAICGPLTGQELTLLPSTVAEWGSWRDRHPDTSVLLPLPHQF